MKRTLHTLIIFAAATLAGCIVEFNPNIADEAEDLLVVEGTITDGETVISLNWSVDLISSVPGAAKVARPVSGARVWVDSEAGPSFPAEEDIETIETVDYWGQSTFRYIPTGRYRIATGTLDDNTRYRVRIEHLQQEYVSKWRPPQSTPPTGDVNFHGKDGMVQVRLNLTAEPDDARTFMWTYEETWEIQSDYSPTHYLGITEGDYNDRSYSVWDYQFFWPRPMMFEYPELSPLYYCWKYNTSKQVVIADTEKVTENRLRDHVLFEFEDSDDRLSVLYHLKLNQYAIGADAYQYLHNLQENSDNTGSIFSPIPSEMRGNLECTTSPETYVIGFIEVSHVVVSEWLINSADSPYVPVSRDCIIVTWREIEAQREPDTKPDDPGGNDHQRPYYLVWGADNKSLQDSSFSTLSCIDCRARGGSKVRPSWWPNDHY